MHMILSLSLSIYIYIYDNDNDNDHNNTKNNDNNNDYDNDNDNDKIIVVIIIMQDKNSIRTGYTYTFPETSAFCDVQRRRSIENRNSVKHRLLKTQGTR